MDIWEGFQPMAHRVLDKPQSSVEQTKLYLQPQQILAATDGSPTTLNMKERHKKTGFDNDLIEGNSCEPGIL